jgi:hypothetical protein
LPFTLTQKTKRYNILSIDGGGSGGGGIRGVIPAILADYMETYGFQYALKKKIK